VVDRGSARGDLRAAVAAAVAGGVDRIQIRERGLGGAALLALCDELGGAAREAARRRGRSVEIAVNRFADAALAAGADALHLGFDAMDPASARLVVGDALRLGVSLHDPDEDAAGADYAHLAPVFAPLSKSAPSRPPLGLAGLRRAAGRGLPILAQGGVTAENAAALCAAGAAGVAVTGAILMQADPGAAARRLRAALDGARA